MSRKYTAWATNQLPMNPDLPTMMRLATVGGNEQDQLKNFERVEAIPHMYINVDAPPPMTTKLDTRTIQPTVIQNSPASYFAAPSVVHTPSNMQTKIWPVEKPVRSTSIFENGSSTSKRPHKHKHHHHHHHHGEKHHHRHHSRRHRAKSAESIRNRQNPATLETSKMAFANSQYLEQDQQQPMIVYREVGNGDSYTVDPNGFASVPYATETEAVVGDDQQAPMVVYRDGNLSQPQQHQSIISDGFSQDVFYNQDQDGHTSEGTIPLQPITNKVISHRVAERNETHVNSYSPYQCTQTAVPACSNVNYIQEIERIYIEEDCCPPLTTIVQQTTDPFFCLPQQQQQTSQIVYCTDPNQQDYLCASNNNNIIQQTVTSSPQQQFVCVDNCSSTLQPTIINQIPVFNPLSATSNSPSIVTVPQTSLQRATSVIIQQPQPQPLQIIQQPQPQPLQVIQQPQPLQLIQQPQQLQIIPSQQTQAGQFVQIASATPQVIQTIQPQLVQNPSVLQTIQVPTQAIAGSPQLLYQRPYDPVVVPVQNQQMAVANSPLLALSQPSYAPARIPSVLTGGQSQGPNMFRHALLQTVAGRAGVPLPSAAVAAPAGSGGAIQLMQPTITTPMASNPNLILGGNIQRSSSVPIVPLTPGGLLIPFQPSQTAGAQPGLFSQTGGRSNLRNFNDIRQHIQEQRALIARNLQQQQQRSSRIPSPPVISAASGGAQRSPYAARNTYSNSGLSRPPFASGAASTYAPLGSNGLNYSRPSSAGFGYTQPSYAGSNAGSIESSPYRLLR
ncbi:unnamed protein product [Adineta ricciae]|uniref:Uncharacterized protein n=1 Tax=Adineta ricciae TaxID=249248 RepID=A0A813QVK9_ADIRI|nr:unnamed protein product [Adineta ricciae]